MPVGTSVCVPPRRAESDCFRMTASSPQQPISIAALAMLCPRTLAPSTNCACDASTSGRPSTRGASPWLIASQAVSIVSAL